MNFLFWLRRIFHLNFFLERQYSITNVFVDNKKSHKKNSPILFSWPKKDKRTGNYEEQNWSRHTHRELIFPMISWQRRLTIIDGRVERRVCKTKAHDAAFWRQDLGLKSRGESLAPSNGTYANQLLLFAYYSNWKWSDRLYCQGFFVLFTSILPAFGALVFSVNDNWYYGCLSVCLFVCLQFLCKLTEQFMTLWKYLFVTKDLRFSEQCELLFSFVGCSFMLKEKFTDWNVWLGPTKELPPTDQTQTLRLNVWLVIFSPKVWP